MKLEDHPTVIAYRNHADQISAQKAAISSEWIKQQAIEGGAADAGIIELEREGLNTFRSDLLRIMPDTVSILVLVYKLNRTALESIAHSVIDLEFKHVSVHANHSGRAIAERLRINGIKALNMPAGFPMETSKWPGQMWLTPDKIFAIESGLGKMGWSRLILHPKFGAGIFIGSILLNAACDQYDHPLDFNPCLQCGLCVKVCPTGAVKRTNDFNFTACYTHNYRERLGGFLDWVQQITDSKNHADYRRRISDKESVSMWQNLSIGPQTRCDRCMSVCPAGEDVIGEYLNNRKDYLENHVKVYENIQETVYVVKGSDAEQHVKTGFPTKTAKTVSNGLRPDSAEKFVGSLPLIFQPGQSEGLNAVYHFTFTGSETIMATVIIRNQQLEVQNGHTGKPDLSITADSQTWLSFLARETHLVKALITRKIKLKGSPKLMMAFGKCFPL